MSARYGEFGGPNKLIEAYIAWRDDRLAKVEEGLIEEADGRADFPEFLYGPIKTALWHGYEKVAPVWKSYARKENLSDFRERRLRGINALKGISHVGENGHYEDMSRSERNPAVLSVDTYGGVYSVTRHMIRNDDTGDLLNRNPADMGFAMAVYVVKALIALIESNPTAHDGVAFYHASRGNTSTASNALAEDSLANGLSWIENQNDDDGYPIVVTAATLQVKTPRQEMIARRILGSATAAVGMDTSAAPVSDLFEKGTDNVMQGILTMGGVRRDRYFTDSNDWRLFANPEEVPSFAMGFLDGKEEPFIGIEDPNVRNALGAGVDPYTFEFDSIRFKMRHDFGVAAVDPRGSYWAQVT